MTRAQIKTAPASRPARGIDDALRDGDRLRFEIPPPKDDVDAERLHRKQRLAAAFRLFARNGFASGIAGHITARDPRWTDHFWVNPQGVHFSHIRTSDLILVNDAGEVVEGDGALNGAAFAIHEAIHRARPDVVAAAHTHSLYGKVWATTGRLLDPLSQDACMFYGDHAIFDDYDGVVTTQSEGDRVAAALGPHKALILQNHGLLTAGGTVDATAYWYVALERAAKAQILSESLGQPKILPQQIAQSTARLIGAESTAWLCFQSEWDVLVRQEPDFLD